MIYYGTDREKFELYNNPWEILYIFLGLLFGTFILLMISKYKLIDYN
jgi:hypothetical protein